MCKINTLCRFMVHHSNYSTFLNNNKYFFRYIGLWNKRFINLGRYVDSYVIFDVKHSLNQVCNLKNHQCQILHASGIRSISYHNQHWLTILELWLFQTSKNHIPFRLALSIYLIYYCISLSRRVKVVNMKWNIKQPYVLFTCKWKEYVNVYA